MKKRKVYVLVVDYKSVDDELTMLCDEVDSPFLSKETCFEEGVDSTCLPEEDTLIELLNENDSLYGIKIFAIKAIEV